MSSSLDTRACSHIVPIDLRSRPAISDHRQVFIRACKRIAARRFTSAVCLATALGVYICWWINSYRIFRNLEVRFLNDVGIRQAAYLYGGTFLDVVAALLICVCLVIVVDRLFDGEKGRNGYLAFRHQHIWSLFLWLQRDVQLFRCIWRYS